MGAAVGIFLTLIMILGLLRFYMPIPNVNLYGEPITYVFGIVMFMCFELGVANFLQKDYDTFLPRKKGEVLDYLMMLPFSIVLLPLLSINRIVATFKKLKSQIVLRLKKTPRRLPFHHVNSMKKRDE